MKRKLHLSTTSLPTCRPLPSATLINGNVSDDTAERLTSTDTDPHSQHHYSRQFDFQPNQKTPLLQRIALQNCHQGQYSNLSKHHSHKNRNTGTDCDTFVFPTKSSSTKKTFSKNNNSQHTDKVQPHSFNVALSYNPSSGTKRSLTFKDLLTSLCAPFRSASAISTTLEAYKKRDTDLSSSPFSPLSPLSPSSSPLSSPLSLSSSFEFVPITSTNTSSTMSHDHDNSGHQRRRDEYTSIPSLHSHQFQTSSTQQKFLKTISVYLLAICAIALCSTGALVMMDGETSLPSLDAYNLEGGELTRMTRSINDGDKERNTEQQASFNNVDGSVHKRFHDEGYIAKLRDEFHEWIGHHGREYGSESEKEKRFHIWKENHMRTMEKNEKHGPCKLTGKQVFGSNHFKDLSPEEFKAKYLTGYNGPKVDEMNEKHKRKLRSTSNIFDKRQPPSNERGSEQTSDILSSNGIHDPSILSHRITRHEKVQERYLKHIEQTPKLSKTYYNKEEKAVEKACKCGITYNYGSRRRLARLFKRDSPLFGKTYYNKSEKQMICGSNFSKTYYNNDKNKNKNTNKNYYNYNYNYNNNYSNSNSNSNYNSNKNARDYYKQKTYAYYNNNRSYYNNNIDCSKYKLEADFDYDELSNKRKKSSVSCSWYDLTCWMQGVFTPLYSTSESLYDNYNYPSSMDWRNIGAVTSVHNQGSCGACWAITATETIEAVNYIATGVLKDLSETEIIICEDSCQMCDGGWPQNAYEYVQENGGLPAESSSSYDGSFLMTMTTVASGESDEMSENEIEYIKSTTCPAQGGSSSATRYGAIKGWAYATDRCVCYTDGSGCDCGDQNEALAVMNVASYGPATVCLEASTWQDYTGGVITIDNSGCSSAFLDMNHCVQVVGYSYKDVDSSDGDEGEDHGDENNNSQKEGYWIVRNQWSSYWGMNGYAYVAMGNNTCGILNDMTQVFMDA